MRRAPETPSGWLSKTLSPLGVLAFCFKPENPVHVPIRTFSRWLLAIFFVAAGANHFRIPEFYLGIVPPYFPWPRELVYLSGTAEILGGIGICIPKLRWLAGWGLIALLIAILPVHLHMAYHGFGTAPRWLLWSRVLAQIALSMWVYSTCLVPGKTAVPPR